jgi:alpha-tubulin suppressor-like RCC1 family protein
MSRSLAALGFAVALLAACGGGGDGGATPQPPASVTQTVGSSGGTIAGPNGIELTIPPDALAADAAITIALDSAGAPALPPGGRPIAPMVSITPHGTTFAVPVTLRIPFDATQLPAGERPVLLKTRGNDWQQLVAEADGGTLRAAATSLSWIGVRCCIDPIRIIDQPDDQTAFENGFAFFRVEARGRPEDFAYQWFRDGLPLPGETNPEILVPRVTLADDNTLYMARVTLVSPGFPREDSRAARLLVQPLAPRIVNQPIDTEVVAGQRATFVAASTSSVAQTLQWERCDPGCNALPNETAAVLSFVAQQADDGASLRLCATNSAGTTCSRAARLSVLPQPVRPAITQQPQALTVAAGSSASFAVLATGGSLSFEWHSGRDATNFALEPRCVNSATCTLSNAALTDDGTFFRVRAFNSAGSVLSASALLTVRPNPGAALARVGAGGGHSIGLRANATLRAWGRNGNGQLGDGTFDARNDAVDVVGLTDVATFSVGADHTLAIRANGEVWAWGRNRDGQLGDGTTADRATPQPVRGLAPARAVAASLEPVRSFSLAVLADGTVRAWGDNTFGQLGDGTVTDRPTPVQSGSLTEMASVAAGSRHALALRRDGAVWAWGANVFGQLGDGTTTASLVPLPIAMPAPIVAIAAGGHSSLALTGTGQVLAWGFNVSGGIGDGTTENRTAPVAVQLPAPAIAIAAAWDGHALALLADGRVFAWGFNEYGQCGFGTDTPAEPAPGPVTGLPPNVVAIGAGANHSLALDAAGNVWAWGNNSAGQLNDGTAASQRETPVIVRNVNLN